MYRTRLDHPLLGMGSNIVNIYKENANIGIVIETSIKSSYGEGGNSPNFQRLSWWHTCVCQRDTMLIYDLIMLHVDINKSHVKAEGRSMLPRYSYTQTLFVSLVDYSRIL